MLGSDHRRKRSNWMWVGGSMGCYGVPGYLGARSEPLIAIGERGNNGGKPAITAIGMAFAPAATKLEITLPNGSHQTIYLRELNPKQARKIGLERLRYAAFAVRGPWCAQRLVSLNAAGHPLWESDEYKSCSAEPGE